MLGLYESLFNVNPNNAHAALNANRAQEICDKIIDSKDFVWGMAMPDRTGGSTSFKSNVSLDGNIINISRMNRRYGTLSMRFDKHIKDKLNDLDIEGISFSPKRTGYSSTDLVIFAGDDVIDMKMKNGKPLQIINKKNMFTKYDFRSKSLFGSRSVPALYKNIDFEGDKPGNVALDNAYMENCHIDAYNKIAIRLYEYIPSLLKGCTGDINWLDINLSVTEEQWGKYRDLIFDNYSDPYNLVLKKDLLKILGVDGMKFKELLIYVHLGMKATQDTNWQIIIKSNLKIGTKSAQDLRGEIDWNHVTPSKISGYSKQLYSFII